MHWYWGIIPDDLLFSSFGVCFVGFCFLILLFPFSQSFFLGERFSTVVSIDLLFVASSERPLRRTSSMEPLTRRQLAKLAPPGMKEQQDKTWGDW